MSQNFSSANTSINGKKLPALYSKVDFEAINARFNDGVVVLDYGCGKYNNGKEYIENQGGVWYGYDPYNRSEAENANAIWRTDLDGVDCVLCANVLNVVDSIFEVDHIAAVVSSRPRSMDYPQYTAKIPAPFFVSVYEGDRSGTGKQTGPDQWQRNEKTSSYLRFFPAGTVIKHGVITNYPEYVK